ncbi:rRNA maturation RNase YbeY [Candidatus Falkowbacteria bacterium]|nr:rRNA maturation RNase YbeY [Candidatus Falkowbacteria bacterium]NCT54363.1 rRNA maturation RNase YbeY [Candidatus Falkowbacteria bacterium]
MLAVLNLTKKKFSALSLKKLAEDFLKKYKIEKAEISLVLIGDKRSRTLNKKYRQKDYLTDVLSFSNPDFKIGKDNFLGEIFINLAEINRLKKYEAMFLELENFKVDEFLKASKSVKEKYLLYFIFIHGLLHLLGFDDEDDGDREKMLRLGANFLKCYN